MSNGNRNWIASISLLPSPQWLPIPLKTQLPTKKKEKNPTKSLPVLVSFLIHTTFCLLNATTVTCSSCYFSNIQSVFFPPQGIRICWSFCLESFPPDLCIVCSLIAFRSLLTCHLLRGSFLMLLLLLSVPLPCLIFLHTTYHLYYMFI